ncbi:MAG: hypothetical protein HY895_17650 [Deltaproteobacteria bacterium]|nr:hypothetical protein [Deltaproteobacteria bacterium]
MGAMVGFSSDLIMCEVAQPLTIEIQIKAKMYRFMISPFISKVNNMLPDAAHPGTKASAVTTAAAAFCIHLPQLAPAKKVERGFNAHPPAPIT